MTKTLLLADDSVTIQRVVELTFAHEDVKVVAVDDGDRAIEALRRSPPDVVLADIAMPGRTGYEVASFVRQQPQLTNLPVLLLAGAFDAVDQAQARDAGADGILIKPFDPAVLVGRVRELLASGRPQPTEAPVQTGPAVVGSLMPPLPAASPALPSSPVSDADRYFEEIDHAFAALSRAPRPPAPAADDRVDEEDAALAPVSPIGPTQPIAAGAQPPVSGSPMPLTDAFAALLDAERTGVPVPAAVVAGTGSAAVPQAPAVDLDALADLVAKRVLEQLSDRVVRETVADLVTATAERLVREEIDRIKRNIT